MRLVDRLYDWLSRGASPDCDRVFAAALTHAEPAWAERIVHVLLLRNNETAWAALIGRYDLLTPEIRARLQASPDQLQAGIALAMKSPSAEKRANALQALEEQPHVRMAYLLSRAIRDPAPAVRALAGRVWRKMADEFLGHPPPENADTDRRDSYQKERKRFRLALEEALQTFDLNRRPEVLEVCLWFAEDLGQVLWERLTATRSRAATVVAENLRTWNHPRLARFLVTALRQPGWRDTARQILQGWSSVPQITALLAESNLLDDPAMRQALRGVQSPKWFTKIDDHLSQLPPGLRPLAPRWVCHAGYREAEKTALLSRWLGAPDPSIHRATVYALAEVDGAGAHALLKEVASSDSPLASFARWSTLALDTATVSAAISGSTEHSDRARHSASLVPPGPNSADTDCATLWQACRRASPEARGELIAALREHAGAWRTQLRAYLQSPDPRDRILVLQVISTEQLALQFCHDIEPLLSDPVKGIRELTQTLVRSLSHQPLPQRMAPLEPRLPEDAPHEAVAERTRHELRATLEQLATGAVDAANTEMIAKVRNLLREVYAEPQEPAPTDPSTEKVS